MQTLKCFDNKPFNVLMSNNKIFSFDIKWFKDG